MLKGETFVMTDVTDLNDVLLRFELGTLESDGSKLSGLSECTIFLYGAGNIGRRLYSNLISNGISIKGFIDRNKDIALPGISLPVYQPDAPDLEGDKEKSVIIIAGLFSVSVCSDIKTTLSVLGYKNIYTLNEINFSEINNGSFYENLFDNSYNKVDILGKDRERVVSAFNLFHKDEDRRLFMQHLVAHLTMDFVRLPVPHDISLQYLAHDIAHEKNYTRFVDCGGYDGDTFRGLVSHGCVITHLAAFEPQVDLYKKYATTVRELSAELVTAVLYPCGAHSDTTQMRFANCTEAKSTGKVDDSGNEIIQCVKLDEALSVFSPTFIKMDIEGAEVHALEGARSLINKYAPQLAICVYHSLSDLWEVPNLINEIRDDYKFYLRNYNYMGLETVLYAFPGSDAL